MRLRSVIRCLLPGAVAALVFVPAALAQPSTPPSPAQVAGECIEAMRATTMRTSQSIRETTERGLMRMRHLAQEGAPLRVIAEVASETAERINAIADGGRDRVRKHAARCVRRLREMEAPQRFIEAVLGAKDEAIARINTSAQRGKHALRSALRAIAGHQRPMLLVG